MIFFVRLALTGEFEKGALRAALAAARPRHPLLFSALVGDPGGRTQDLAWHPLGEEASVHVSWYDGDDDGDWARINIRAEPGVRLHLARIPTGETRLTAAFHHANTDGRGAMRFLEDVLAAHAGLLGSDGDASLFMRPTDPSLLTRLRGREWPRPGGASAPRQAVRLVMAVAKWLINVAPLRLATPSPVAGTARAGPLQRRGGRASAVCPAHVEVTLTPGEVAVLRAAAGGRGASLNDVLLAAVFAAVDAWNARHGGAGHWGAAIRVGIAQCLRDADAVKAAPAANIMGTKFIDRRSVTIRGGDLLPSLAAETAHIKAAGLAGTCTATLAAVGAVPGCMAWLFQAGRAFTTTYVSNLGVVLADTRLPALPGGGGLDVGGGVNLKGVTLILPLPTAGPVMFGVATFGGTLRLALRYDTTTWTDAHARELAADVESRLRAMLVAPPPPLSPAPRSPPHALPITVRRRVAQSDAATACALEAGRLSRAASWPPPPLDATAATPALSIRYEYEGAVVFLTGATGYIGSVVLERILRCTEAARVVCLVRGKRGLTPAARIDHLLNTRSLFGSLRARKGFWSRISVVEGDAQAPGLGLAPVVWASLVASATHIIHCAASISFNAPVHALLSQNYDSTSGALALAAACGPRLRSVVHVSTAYVNGHLPRGSLVHETTYDLEVGQDGGGGGCGCGGGGKRLDHAALAASLRAADPAAAEAITATALKMCGLPNAYCLTKHMAERLVVDFSAAAARPGMAIVRPSIVGALAHGPAAGYVGNSSCATSYILACATGMGTFTPYRAYSLMDIVPGDIVASVILGASAAAAVAAARGGGGGGATRDHHPIILHAAASTTNPITHLQLLSTLGPLFIVRIRVKGMGVRLQLIPHRPTTPHTTHVLALAPRSTPHTQANPRPLRFIRSYFTLAGTDAIYMTERSAGFRVCRALATVKFALIAAALRLAGQAQASAVLWAQWCAWCAANTSAFDFGVCFSSRNAAALEAALPADERTDFPMLWSADRLADDWASYLKTYLDEIQARYLARMRGGVGGGRQRRTIRLVRAGAARVRGLAAAAWAATVYPAFFNLATWGGALAFWVSEQILAGVSRLANWWAANWSPWPRRARSRWRRHPTRTAAAAAAAAPPHPSSCAREPSWPPPGRAR